MDRDDGEDKIFWYLAAASGAHVVEEYFWPGGFLESAKEIAPEAFEHASLPIIVGVNASMIVGCVFGALIRKRSQVLGLSMASLLFQNAILHTGAALKAKKYVPGLVTGLVLYVPLSVSAFKSYMRLPQHRRSTAINAAVLGTALHSIPFVAFAVRAALTRGSDKVEGSEKPISE
jgi:hypothetical protein